MTIAERAEAAVIRIEGRMLDVESGIVLDMATRDMMVAEVEAELTRQIRDWQDVQAAEKRRRL